MTIYQQNLLEQATDMWQRGKRIPITLYSQLAAEGMDVPKLEEQYFMEES